MPNSSPVGLRAVRSTDPNGMAAVAYERDSCWILRWLRNVTKCSIFAMSPRFIVRAVLVLGAIVPRGS